MTKAFFTFHIAVLALTCVVGRLAATDIGGMPTMMGPPPPPAAPAYTNAYFNLTWTWTGGGFDISGTVANPNGGPGVTYTGGVGVMETWALQGGANGPQWVRQSDTGWYSTGNTQTSRPGYITWQSSTSTTFSVPSNQKQMSVISVNSQSTVANGAQTSKTANITTWFANGSPVNIQGQLRTDDTLTDATSVTESILNTRFNGPPGQQDTITVESVTTYTDATKTLLSSSVSAYKDVDTTLNPNGSVASSSIYNSTNTQEYATTVDPYGNKGASLLNSDWNVTETTQGNDANGTQVSSSSQQRSRVVANTVYKPGDMVVQVRPQSITAKASVSDNPQTGPPYTASLVRTTTWAAPAAGSYPSSFNGQANVNGNQTQLQLGWDANNHLTGMTDANGQPTKSQATQEYDAIYQIECDLMEMAPAPGEYPFYPWLVPGPMA